MPTGFSISCHEKLKDKRQDLTPVSRTYPPESMEMTPYTAVATQARFHIAAHACYARIISKPSPSAEELLCMETDRIESWQASIPSCFAEQTNIAPRYAFSQAVMSWRVRNLRIIMYRSFVISRMLMRQTGDDPASQKAFDKCLADAKSTIETTAAYWNHYEPNRLTAWYNL
jgi:transcriptional regulatory protein GAL4